MRGAFGKPLGTVARVDIGQPLLSVRTYDKHKASVIEALRRTKFKFPGRQKVCLIQKNCSRMSSYKSCITAMNKVTWWNNIHANV